MATEEITISKLELADEVLADMTLPVDTATETRAVTLKQLRAWLGSSLPTGFIIPAVGKISDERFTLLDGKTLSRAGTYEAFCNKVISEVQAGNWFACSEDEYNSDISTYGQCGKFVVSDDYIRIPTITRFIGATITLSEIGKTYKESLPNIKGTFGNDPWGKNLTGAFYSNSTNSPQYEGKAATGKIISFNASRSSSTYQDNAKVQPDHTKYPYYMVVSPEGQTANVEIDINKVYEDLNLKATTDLSNVSSVASSFKKASVVWGMPDYDRAISISLNSVFVPQVNGYIEVFANSINRTQGIQICWGSTYDETKMILKFASGSYDGFIYAGRCEVEAGQEYYIFSNASGTNRATFIPMKGANNA